MMKKAIIGAGGFGREVYWSLAPTERLGLVFFVDDLYWDGRDGTVLPMSDFDPSEYEVVVAIGDPEQRRRVVGSLPTGTRFFTHVHESVSILDPNVVIGEGSIVCAGTVITCNVRIGRHAHLNLQSSVGHDVEIGDFFTTAPGARVSGNCRIGDLVYLGTNSAVRERTNVCDGVTVGMQAAVVRDILRPGTYVGVPAKMIQR